MKQDENLFWSITGSWIFLAFLYACCLLYLFIASGFSSIEIVPTMQEVKNLSTPEILVIASVSIFLFYAQIRSLM